MVRLHGAVTEQVAFAQETLKVVQRIMATFWNIVKRSGFCPDACPVFWGHRSDLRSERNNFLKLAVQFAYWPVFVLPPTHT